MKITTFTKYTVLLLTISLLFTACKPRKDLSYFTNIPDTLKQTLKMNAANFEESIIQPNDVLNIVIQTIDPSSSQLVNQALPTGSMTAGASTVPMSTLTGFIVDKNGVVKLPWIGDLKLAGLTIFQARELVQSKAETFFKQPNVQVTFAQYKITILGEVLHPAVYNIPFEKTTILDAISTAGDITIYGKKDNVLLVRDSLNQKIFVRLNLNSSDIFKSPYYYLKQNDIIYVEAGKDKVVTSEAYKTRTITITVTLLSAFIVLLSRFVK